MSETLFAGNCAHRMMVLTNGEGGLGMPAAIRALGSGSSALDAVVAGIRPVEADPAVRSVGVGGVLNLLSQLECDASIMDGATLRTGAVGALQGFIHPISVARQVMERLPHVMLVGEGAARFAREVGAGEGETSTPQSLADYRAWMDSHVPAETRTSWNDAPLAAYAWPPSRAKEDHGTTVWIAIDASGNLAGGVSTSGWPYKYPGRIGDSPIIGAGLYVDNRFGACACTHTGEMAIRAATARSVVLYMKKGASVEDACMEAAEDLDHLRGGYIGFLVIHAIDRGGRPCVVSTQPRGAPPRFWTWHAGMSEAELRVGEVRLQTGASRGG